MSIFNRSKKINKNNNFIFIEIQQNNNTNNRTIKDRKLYNKSNIFFDLKDPYAFANTLEKCSELNCPKPNICVADDVCKCSEDSSSFLNATIVIKNKTEIIYCEYQRKNQIIAFLLEFFIVSAGHFYSGNYVIASIKIQIPILMFLFYFFGHNNSKQLTNVILLTVLALWWVFDFALYAFNIYRDQNGVKLKEW